jgi:hypothetical protein
MCKETKMKSTVLYFFKLYTTCITLHSVAFEKQSGMDKLLSVRTTSTKFTEACTAYSVSCMAEYIHLPMHKEFLVAENKFREIIIYIYGDY